MFGGFTCPSPRDVFSVHPQVTWMLSNGESRKSPDDSSLSRWDPILPKWRNLIRKPKAFGALSPMEKTRSGGLFLLGGLSPWFVIICHDLSCSYPAPFLHTLESWVHFVWLSMKSMTKNSQAKNCETNDFFHHNKCSYFGKRKPASLNDSCKEFRLTYLWNCLSTLTGTWWICYPTTGLTGNEGLRSNGFMEVFASQKGDRSSTGSVWWTLGTWKIQENQGSLENKRMSQVSFWMLDMYN